MNPGPWPLPQQTMRVDLAWDEPRDREVTCPECEEPLSVCICDRTTTIHAEPRNE